MVRHPDGSITGLLKVRAASHPTNARQEDALLNAESFTPGEAALLAGIIDHYIEDEA